MSFEKPPSMNDYSKIIPIAPRELTRQKKMIRFAMLGFAATAIILLLVNLSTSDLTAPLRGTGSLQGVALDANGKPLLGVVMVEGTSLTVKTNTDGSFQISNVPAGDRVIVVSDTLSGREFHASIQAGQITNLGSVQLKSTATP